MRFSALFLLLCEHMYWRQVVVAVAVYFIDIATIRSVTTFVFEAQMVVLIVDWFPTLQKRPCLVFLHVHRTWNLKVFDEYTGSKKTFGNPIPPWWQWKAMYFFTARLEFCGCSCSANLRLFGVQRKSRFYPFLESSRIFLTKECQIKSKWEPLQLISLDNFVSQNLSSETPSILELCVN